MIGSTNDSVLTSLSTSAIVSQQVYGPYGNTRYQVGSMGTTKGYTGQFHDAVSGLDYYHARYYDPVVGQFLSVDEKQGNAQGADPYSYVAGNPETATDPTGLRISCPPDCGTTSGGLFQGTPCAFAHGMRNEMVLCKKIPPFQSYANDALLTGCLTGFRAAARELENLFPFSTRLRYFSLCSHQVRTLNEPAKRIEQHVSLVAHPVGFGGTGCGGDCGDRCGGGGPSPMPKPAPTPTPGNNSGGLKCGSGTHQVGDQCVANVTSCGQGLVNQNGTCVEDPRLKERDNALQGKLWQALGLLGAGALIVMIGNIYLLRHLVKQFAIPEMVNVIADMIGLALEVGNVVQTLAPALAWIVDAVAGLLHGALAAAHIILGVFEGAAGFWNVVKGTVIPILNVVGIAVEGVPGELFDLADQLFGNSIANIAVSAGHTMMALGDVMLGQYHQQEAMNISDWCAQYGSGVCTAGA